MEANWGDYIEVTVQNSIFGPSEGTTLHWSESSLATIFRASMPGDADLIPGTV